MKKKIRKSLQNAEFVDIIHKHKSSELTPNKYDCTIYPSYFYYEPLDYDLNPCWPVGHSSFCWPAPEPNPGNLSTDPKELEDQFYKLRLRKFLLVEEKEQMQELRLEMLKVRDARMTVEEYLSDVSLVVQELESRGAEDIQIDVCGDIFYTRLETDAEYKDRLFLEKEKEERKIARRAKRDAKKAAAAK